MQVSAYSDENCEQDEVTIDADNLCNEYPLGMQSVSASGFVADTTCSASGFGELPWRVCCEL